MGMLGDDAYYMRMAIKEAMAAAGEDEVPVGAVVVCNGKIIARAHNQTQQLNDATAHAEMLAITSASNWIGGKYLHGCTLYVTVEPCAMCAGAIGWAQLERVVYGAADPMKGYSHIAPCALHPKTEAVGGVMAEECSKVMKDYFKGKRRKAINTNAGGD